MNMLKKFFSNKIFKIAVIAFLLIAAFFVCILIGSVRIGFVETMKILFLGGGETSHSKIILTVRLPRVVSALICGGALALSGVIIQSLFNNPMASPSIIGVNSGSGFFVLLSFIIFPNMFFMQPVMAFAGGFIASLMVFFIGYKTYSSRLTLVLSGIAISALLNAFSDIILTLVEDGAMISSEFKIGGLNGMTMDKLLVPAIITAACFLVSILFSFDLNVLSMGEVHAKSLGVKIWRTRLLFIVLSAALSGVAVAIAGLIGFVGLIVPHIVRYMFGEDNRLVLPMSFVCGGLFVMLCDLLARTVFTPYEIPVGIVLSIIGVPFFLFLLLKNRRRKRV